MCVCVPKSLKYLHSHFTVSLRPFVNANNEQKIYTHTTAAAATTTIALRSVSKSVKHEVLHSCYSIAFMLKCTQEEKLHSPIYTYTRQ